MNLSGESIGEGVHEDSFIVIDDYYTDPDTIRNWAISQNYAGITQYNYPGFQAAKPMHAPALRSKIEQSIGRKITVDEKKYTFGGFRIITGDSGQRRRVHCDAVSDWAAMVYLTPGAPPGSGTGFFRHRKYGCEGPPSLHEAMSWGFGSPEEFERRVVVPAATDPDAWELVRYVEPVFNRFVAFRGGRFYHAPLGGTGGTAATARLTHIFFFDEAPTDADSTKYWSIPQDGRPA